jgi:hypothetical protein
MGGGQTWIPGGPPGFRVAVLFEGEETGTGATEPISAPEVGGKLISVQEYLSTGCEHKDEYEYDVIVGRNVGEFEHCFSQAILITLLSGYPHCARGLPGRAQRPRTV